MQEQPKFVKHDLGEISTFQMSSIWKDSEAEVSFSFINFDYPIAHIQQDFCEILCVFSGEIINRINSIDTVMRSGDCCIVLSEDKHELHFTKEGRKSFVAINYLIRSEYFKQLKYLFGINSANIFESPETKYFHLEKTFQNAIYNKTLLLQTPNNIYLTKNEFTCKGIIIDLLKQFAAERLNMPEKKTLPEWLENFLVEIQNPNNFNRSPSDFISEISYSYSYIAKEFKKHLGCSIVTYLTTVKLNYARELLLHTDISMLEISSRLGFSSLSHFNHIFKRAYGKTPKEVRKNRTFF